MAQSYFSEAASLEIAVSIRSRLGKYGIQPKLDDSDCLRAYLVITSLEEKASDRSGWLLGFLICASIWALQTNGWPFAWMSEILKLFGWPYSVIVLCNLSLLIAFWIAAYLLLSGRREQQTLPWQASDAELDDLGKRVSRMIRAHELSDS